MIRGLVVIAALSVFVGCSPKPTANPSDVRSSSPVALASPNVRPSPSPTQTPEPTPIFVRFDIENGPRQVIVWMTNDRGAEARVFEPGQRRTLFVPLFEGTSIDVYVDGCERIAHIDWLPGSLPSTIVLSNDPQGAGYVIDIQPGVSGTPVPESTFDFPPCSG